MHDKAFAKPAILGGGGRVGWRESLCLAQRGASMGSFHLCSLYLAWFSLCYRLDSITRPFIFLRGMCVPVITCQAWGSFLTLLCVNYLNLALWDDEMPLLPQGGGSGPGRREGEQRIVWKMLRDSQKVSFSISRSPKTRPCMHTCIQAYKGCLWTLFPFKLITGDMIWVLILEKCLSTSVNTRRRYHGSWEFPCKGLAVLWQQCSSTLTC